MLSLNNKKEDSGLKILIFISGGAQIRRHICIVDLYRWLLKVETLDGWVNTNKLDGNSKTIVLSDMHELLSKAKNSTAYNIRTEGQRS